MPVKSPILQGKHISIIVLVSIIAGLIGVSPYLYSKFSGSNRIEALNGSISRIGENITGTYHYVFPLIRSKPVYYFPIVSRAYDSYIQAGSPVYISNFAHPEAGCNWEGVAGQVFGKDGGPINGYTVVVSGSINGKPITLSGMTGTAQAYGVGGYEVKISTTPFSSTGKLTVYLLNNELKSEAAPVSLTTYQDCQSNLIILNYKSNG